MVDFFQTKEAIQAYSGTLSRRNFRRLWATLGDFSKIGIKIIATLGDLGRLKAT